MVPLPSWTHATEHSDAEEAEIKQPAVAKETALYNQQEQKKTPNS